VPPDAEVAPKDAAGTSPWGAPATRTDHGRNRRTLTALLAAGAAVGAVLGVWWLGGRAGDDRPPRAYAAAPGASVIAMPPPTGTGAPSSAAPKGEGTCLLHLSSRPPSTVILDGKVLGTSPRRSISVWAGTHTVLFRSTDGQTKKALVTCAPGETRIIDVPLRDLPSVDNHAAEPAPCPLCERP
jgi:hypothetical protein